MDQQTIKDRVRKLMAVAGDGVATDGEIENAMRLATKLIDEHHLQPEDYSQPQQPDDLTMGRSFGTSQSERMSTWERTLASAIAKMFGCIKCYVDHQTQPIRVNGVAQTDATGVRMGRKICFYGPLVESAEAADLFSEWSRSIASMGVIRWGGCFRGDGAMYCQGFAQAILDKARKIDTARQLVQAKPIPQFSGDGSTAITLAGRYGLLRDAAEKYLRDECKVKLSTTRSSGYRSGDRGAYSEGHAHGSQADFGRASKRKMITG
eukprot:gnl/Spiro4/16852_TR9073_c0_g1_i1.p2 gnl/Spiro4/16852_TR9073_c0_g1~~gnl/Spiro4/16852_TR9073_c0_g1_i1.p2  ORF type:complete len:264 (-),score=24.00 gnl/Spiro4/16852_TR9073_c0_g1_i1:2671-3462(-)